MKLESAHGDMSSWREIDFALNCTYIVPDQVSDPSFSLPKAMTSIPRNLTFEYGADNEVRTRSGESWLVRTLNSQYQLRDAGVLQRRLPTLLLVFFFHNLKSPVVYAPKY